MQYDQSKDPLDRSLLPEPVTVIDTTGPVTWGDASYLDEILASLEHCLGEQWEWLALISGQDYPIRPTADLVASLGNAAGVLMTRVVPPPGAFPTWSEDQRRYWFKHHWIPARAWRLGGGARGIGRVCRLVISLPRVRDRAYYRSRPRGASGGIGVLARRLPFDLNMPCRKGFDYFLLRRDLAEELAASAIRQQELLDHFRHAAIPTEGWFHTVLGSAHESELVPQPLTFCRFGSSAHPRLFVETDLAEAVESQRFFARKFDESSGGLLDRIDVELLGLETAPRESER